MKYFKATVVVFILFLIFSFITDPTLEDKIRYAGQLVGLDFSTEEINLMTDNVKDMQEDILKNRSQHLDNGLSPVLSFDPRPSGYDMPDPGPSILKVDINDQIELPHNPDDLAFYDISQLASLIKSKKISSVELTRYYLNRLKAYDPMLHCVISYTEERALKQAKAMDREISLGRYRGLLHGIPCGIKDLLSTEGVKTTWGANPFKDQVIDHDAAVVEMMEEAGAVIVAKLTLGALAWGDVWYGEKTRNPWDTLSGSSGSSAGSASAVSAGLVPFAIGTETLGSIVSPSTVCGTTGLRPTYGRVSRYGAMALCWSLDKIGPITRNAEDAAIVLHAINGPDPRDMHNIPMSFSYRSEVDISKYKVGYVKSAFDGQYRFKTNDSIALEKIKEYGIELIPVELPDFPDIGMILSAEAAAAFDELTTSGMDDSLKRQIARAWPNVFRAARLIPAVEYIKANRLRRILIEDMHHLMEEYDAIIHPSWGSSALSITNYTGHPTIVFPNGFQDGKPTSMSITGKLFGEEAIIHLAKFYQDITAHHLKHPKL